MISPDDVTSMTQVCSTMKFLYGYGTKNVLKELYLIPLHPERLTVEYGNVFDDEDGTRVFEEDFPILTGGKRKSDIFSVAESADQIPKKRQKQVNKESWSRVWGLKAGVSACVDPPSDSD
jgi:hypothetical protein